MNCVNCRHECHCDYDECSESEPAENGMGEIIPIYCGCPDCEHEESKE